jgi:hypothetical protein
MATSNGSTCPVLVLTPELFADLDCIARAHGSAVEVVRAEDMRDTVGRINALKGDGYKDSRVREGVCMTDLSIIEIANRIDCGEVWSWTRPELDYSKIAAKDMYHFVVWHEIGHRAQNLWGWYNIAASLENREVLHWLNEVRADRFAWKKIYPRKRLPVSASAERTQADIAESMPRMEALFLREQFRPRPLPADPHLMVPASHVRRGIPWASLA